MWSGKYPVPVRDQSFELNQNQNLPMQRSFHPKIHFFVAMQATLAASTSQRCRTLSQQPPQPLPSPHWPRDPAWRRVVVGCRAGPDLASLMEAKGRPNNPQKAAKMMKKLRFGSRGGERLTSARLQLSARPSVIQQAKAGQPLTRNPLQWADVAVGAVPHRVRHLARALSALECNLFSQVGHVCTVDGVSYRSGKQSTLKWLWCTMVRHRPRKYAAGQGRCTPPPPPSLLFFSDVDVMGPDQVVGHGQHSCLISCCLLPVF